MTPFGETVLLWRLARALTQNELAKKTGIPRPNLSAIERGKREVSLKTIRSLALALDVSAGTLVDGLAPGRSGLEHKLTREAMERVAKAVVRQTNLDNANEKALAQHLSHLTKTRLHSMKVGKKSISRLSRKADRAWLTLVSKYPPQTIHNLIIRVNEKIDFYGQKSD